jgi:hypothetical protein
MLSDAHGKLLISDEFLPTVAGHIIEIKIDVLGPDDFRAANSSRSPMCDFVSKVEQLFDRGKLSALGNEFDTQKMTDEIKLRQGG